MVQGCCENLTKFLMFLFNILVALCGLAIVIVGAVALHQARTFGGSAQGGAIALIVLGSIVFLIAFLGFCGAIMENSIMLIFFIILLSILVIIEITIGIVVMIHKSDINSYVQQEMYVSFKNYRTFRTHEYFWDGFQIDNKCCGIQGPGDYGQSQPSGQFPPHGLFPNFEQFPNIESFPSIGQFPNRGFPSYEKIPAACCGYHDTTRTCHNPVQNGCEVKLIWFYENILKYLAGTAIGLGCVQITGIIFACYLFAKFR